MKGKWLDLSQEYYEGMPPGRSNPEKACHIKTIQEGDEEGKAHVQQFIFRSHQGTHMDAPRHIFHDGITIDKIPLERFVGTGVVLDIPRGAAEIITADDLAKAKPEVKKGDNVIIRTGWGEKMWYSEDYLNNPYLTVDAALWLAQKEVNMLAVDTITPSMPMPMRTEGFDYPIHRILIGSDILVVENLGNLSAVAGKRVTIAAFPIKIAGGDGSPVRVVALVE